MKRLLLIALFGLLATCSTPQVVEIDKEVVDAGETTKDGVHAELEVAHVICGDEVCDPDKEDCDSCLEDCGKCPCGDGECDLDADEDCATCAEDCGVCCGDESCDAEHDEDCETCALDCGVCPSVCPDEECADDEDCDSCPDDCGPCPAECPDEECNGDEDCESCPEDCDVCPSVCPDGECSGDEDCETCSDDCGECVCPDGACNGDEDCDSCPEDCTNCDPMCGDEIVDEGEECDDGNTAPDDGCDEECKLEPQAVEPGTIVITEIMKNPEFVDDVVGEWFELYNSGDDDVDLSGWLLTDEGIDQHKIFSYDGVVIPAKGYLVFGKEADKELNGGLDVDYVYTNFNLSNKDDEIILSVYGVTIDEVAYDNGQQFPGDPGKSLSLTPSAYNGVDNDDGGAWCNGTSEYGDGDYGTPGGANPDCEGQTCPNGTCNDDEGEDCVSCPQDCGDCCGDEVCDPDHGEDCATCSQDCGPCCPNQKCDQQEDCEICPADCGECPKCPDGECGDDEDCGTCPDDCGQCICPDGECNGDETCGTCPADCGGPCPPVCPDGECNGDETCDSCLQDCGPCCGNNDCEPEYGETCDSCTADCGDCCPNGACDYGETCSTCVADCKPCDACPDGECNGDETCETCAADCGECPEEAWCKLSGSSGEEIECKITIAAESNSSSKATQFQFDINFDSTKIDFDGTTCMSNGFDVCGQFGIIGAGHSVDTQVQSAGVVRLTVTKSGEPENITDAYLVGESVLGNPYVLDLVFSLKTNLSANQAKQVTLTGMKGADATASPLSAIQKPDGLIVTSGGALPFCGDGECNNGETCEDCSDDCGACPPEGGWCELSGSNGEQLACQIDLAAASNSSPKATQFQFDINFSASKIDFDGTKCLSNGFDVCGQFGIIAKGHSVDTQVQQAGVVRLTITKSGTPTTITDAYVSGQSVVGESYALDLLFSLKTNVAANQAVAVTLTEMKGADATASPLSATQNADGVIVTSAQ